MTAEAESEPLGAGGATKQRSNRPAQSPPTGAEEDEAEAFNTSPLRTILSATGCTTGKKGPTLGFDDKVFMGIICAVWNTAWDIFLEIDIFCLDAEKIRGRIFS